MEAPPPYGPPIWGVAGANTRSLWLEVVKGGVVVGTVALPPATDGHPGSSKSFVVVGRMEPACGLVLQHPSVSRVHAALQFGQDGEFALCDLGSTHGTFVNKRRVPAKQFMTLNVGDVVAFGESTRLYAVCGPQELMPPEQRSSRRRKKADAVEKGDDGASWGFKEDAQEEEDDEDEEEKGDDKHEELPDYLRNLKEEDTPYKSSVGKTELNDKDQRLFQQLQAKISKMENLKLEKARILAKQHQLTGLTEGQQQQLARNDQRIETLLREIEDAEEKIHAKNMQREQTAAKSSASATRKKKSASDQLYGYDSDEDDFYDRTRSNQQKLEKRKQQVTGVGAASTAQPTAKGTSATKVEALTADVIEAKIRMLEADLTKVKEQFSTIDVEKASKAADAVNGEEEDPLDSFMTATSRQLVESDRDAVTRRKNELEKGLARHRQLLAIATPALATAGTKSPPTTSPNKEMTTSKTTTTPAPSAQVSSPTVSGSNACWSQELPEGIESSPDPALDTATNPLAATATSVSPSPHVASLLGRPDRDCEPRQAPVQATKARSLERKHDIKLDERVRESKKKRVVGPTLPPVQAKTDVVGETNELEGGDRVWVPPTNQTGDGRTALNDKFGY